MPLQDQKDTEGGPWQRSSSGLPKVHHSVGVPIIADEVAKSIEGVINVIRHDAADMFALHISKAGGLFKWKQYLSIVEAENMSVILGGMARAGLELCANAHLAASTEWCGKEVHHCLGPLQMFGGYDTKHIINENKDVIKGQPAKVERRFLYIPKGPGLGAELDEGQVNRFLTKGKEVLVCEAKSQGTPFRVGSRSFDTLVTRILRFS